MSKKRPHAFHNVKVKGTVKSMPQICGKCGLMALKNAATAKAISAGCLGAETEDAPLTSSHASHRVAS